MEDFIPFTSHSELSFGDIYHVLETLEVDTIDEVPLDTINELFLSLWEQADQLEWERNNFVCQTF
jgi:hypothetical protein